MATHDLLFTVKSKVMSKAVIVFCALTPKGEEFLQRYLVNDEIDYDEMTLIKYRWEAEKLGLTVSIER